MSVFEDSLGAFLGPLQPYLQDDQISEVMVNGSQEIFIEKKGIIQRAEGQFFDEQALSALVRNIAQFVGRKVDDENPILDARLPDGSRVAAVLPPCSRKGTTLAIRKFSKSSTNLAELIQKETLSKDAARFLDVCVYLGKNMIISGGTGSGKTTLLNCIGSRIPSTQRLLIIEDSSELKINTEHVVYFETKPANEQGKGAVGMRDLLKSALRLRPDRIVLGEVRGPEAFDLITAMNTGHGGSMGTVHANTPLDALIRLETLALMSEGNISLTAVRRQIASAVHVIVQIKRWSDGSRKISHISEVIPEVDDAGRYKTVNLFGFIQKSRTAEGKIQGECIPLGNLPSFMQEIELNRIPFGKEKFLAPEWFDPSQM